MYVFFLCYCNLLAAILLTFMSLLSTYISKRAYCHPGQCYSDCWSTARCGAMSECMCQSVSVKDHGPDRAGRLAEGGVPAERSSVLADCSVLCSGADSLVMDRCQTILRSESPLQTTSGFMGQQLVRE